MLRIELLNPGELQSGLAIKTDVIASQELPQLKAEPGLVERPIRIEDLKPPQVFAKAVGDGSGRLGLAGASLPQVLIKGEVNFGADILRVKLERGGEAVTRLLEAIPFLHLRSP